MRLGAGSSEDANPEPNSGYVGSESAAYAPAGPPRLNSVDVGFRPPLDASTERELVIGLVRASQLGPLVRALDKLPGYRGSSVRADSSCDSKFVDNSENIRGWCRYNFGIELRLKVWFADKVEGKRTLAEDRVGGRVPRIELDGRVGVCACEDDPLRMCCTPTPRLLG